uniref:uncharacterized protein LOC108950246 n=1 Tax=Ciona intestinalis TaxID=7719 RepID=UPI000EF45681|nr:uncharacterized protein LOC108950246 [Ciona intestinalis]|eukprot:XP_018670997.2 uncharacterized protein LOC108950246 [Ciona intestinalis]
MVAFGFQRLDDSITTARFSFSEIYLHQKVLDAGSTIAINTKLNCGENMRVRILGSECFGDLKLPFENLYENEWFHKSFENYKACQVFNATWYPDDAMKCRDVTTDDVITKLKFESQEKKQKNMDTTPFTGRYYIIMAVQTIGEKEIKVDITMRGYNGYLNNYEIKACQSRILSASVFALTLCLLVRSQKDVSGIFGFLICLITLEIVCHLFWCLVYVQHDVYGYSDVIMNATAAVMDVFNSATFRVFILSLCMGLGAKKLKKEVTWCVPIMFGATYVIANICYVISKRRNYDVMFQRSAGVFGLVIDAMIAYTAISMIVGRMQKPLKDKTKIVYHKLFNVFKYTGALSVVNIMLMVIVVTNYCQFAWYFSLVIDVNWIVIRWLFIVSVALVYR